MQGHAVMEAASAEAQLANVELNLTRTEVVAPVAGEVVARNAQVGAIASAAAQPMFTLIRDGALELRAEVAEADLPRLTAGQGAQVVGVGTVQPITGTVRLVEPSVDATATCATSTTSSGRARATKSPGGRAGIASSSGRPSCIHRRSPPSSTATRSCPTQRIIHQRREAYIALPSS